MGVSWFLQCDKCEEAYKTLRELDKEDLAEVIAEEARFYLDYDVKTVDVNALMSWLSKHHEHGNIRYNGE